MKIFLDATTLIALGEIGELELLTSFDGELWLLTPVNQEVTTEPARSNLSERIERTDVLIVGLGALLEEAKDAKEEAKRILDEETVNGDVAIITKVIQSRRKEVDVAIVSDDRRLRTVAEGLGARVTGTIGIVVRTVAEGRLTEQEGKDLVRRLDSRGLHMTGELRERADRLIEDATRENGDED